MANQEHLDILKQGVEVWNRWRDGHLFIQPDLSGANLIETNLEGANLSYADLREACFWGADLGGARLWGADLRGAQFWGAKLTGVDLIGANFSEVNLKGVNLGGAILIRTNFYKAILTDCFVYGTSVWDVDLNEAEQTGLIITPFDSDQPTITVDNLEVAQFIYLLLNNPKIRDVI